MLKYKTALVTGGSKRIGAAIATFLAERGYNVAIHYSTSQSDADALVETIANTDNKVLPLSADLTDAKQTRTLFAAAREALGPIDLLINNASIFEPDQASDLDTELMGRHMAIHVEAPALLSQAMAAQTELDDGLIINIIDQRVERPNPTYFSYTLSKSALWTATKTMAQSFAPKIRVNAIGPGPTLPNKRQKQRDFAQQVSALPLQRAPELTEFGRTIEFFAENRSVTGQMIMLDGGQHLAWQTPDLAGQE